MPKERESKGESKQGVVELSTMEAFEAFLAKNDYVAIKFGMPGCGPCKVVAPAFDKLTDRLSKLALASVDATIPEMFDLVDKYTIDKVPAFHFFHRTKHLPDLHYQGVNPDKLWKRAHALSHMK